MTINDTATTVVYRPCPGAPEIQEIYSQLANLEESLEKELVDKYAARSEDGEVFDCREDEPFSWGNDWHDHRPWDELSFEDSPEAKAAIDRHKFSAKAIQACYEALAPINAPFIEAQEKQTRADGATPDFAEAYNKASELSASQPVDHTTVVFDSRFSEMKSET